MIFDIFILFCGVDLESSYFERLDLLYKEWLVNIL